jgi:predicted outer membrane repeat protein
VRGSVLTCNSATQGGGVYNTAGATLDVHGSTFSANTASDSGGGIYNLATATVQQSSFSGNTADSDGGGIFNAASGTLTIDDSELLADLALLAADVYNLGTMLLHDSTIGVIGP